ncbi:vitamin K epoxide reductase family protein [Skermania piniformis]|uniref:Vitamin K epoxide reductase family protein n=1 Tax=Skermania pinensis TaxID=39122 RepID=A0ABX8SBY1_9ACTN|nr:vitamin K epoxide reductase family protein [Skermania piniformis]QXQ15385.1 vitamin K epoxide reductase family protein [Skermania piniformis]
MTATRGAGRYLAGGGAVGLAAASALTIERFELLIDPTYRPSCSINPVLSCGSVMVTDQAAAFGFPNSIIGIVAFTVVAVSGVLLASGTPIPRWYLRGLWAGALLGVVFVHWLIFQSLYRIGALCPYCMVVWAVTIPTFTVLSRLVVARPGPVSAALLEWRWAITGVWFGVVLLLIYLRFESYWNTLW